VVARAQTQVARLNDRLASVWSAELERRTAEVQRVTGRLDALSPLKVLARGYAIATRDDGRAVRSATDVGPGDALHVRVRDARIDTTVTAIEPALRAVGRPEGRTSGEPVGGKR
jgi:exodeoxyribonuclease VII large subunit